MNKKPSGEVESSKKKDIFTIIAYFAITFVVAFVAAFVYIVQNPDIDVEELVLPAWAEFTPMIIMLLVFGALYFKQIMADFKRLSRKNIKFLATILVALLAVGLGLEYLFNFLNIPIGNQESVTEIFRQSAIIGTIITVLYAPIVEEIVFRKALSGVIKNTTAFIAASALIFGLMHLSGVATIIYILIGLLLAIAYIKTEKNLAATITLHAAYNIVGVILLLLAL